MPARHENDYWQHPERYDGIDFEVLGQRTEHKFRALIRGVRKDIERRIDAVKTACQTVRRTKMVTRIAV